MNNQVSKGSGEPTTRTNDNGVKSNASNHRSAQNCTDEPTTGNSARSMATKTVSGVMCENLQVNFDKWIPYPPEFVHFLTQLKEMKIWFSKYGEVWIKVKDEDLIGVGKIGDLLIDLSAEICDLASVEIGSSYFWEDDKSEIVETLKTA